MQKQEQKKWEHVSASQITLFDEGCEEKWAGQYLRGEKAPTTSNLKLGSDVHKCIEGYLENGQYVGADHVIEIARAAESALDTMRVGFKAGGPPPLGDWAAIEYPTSEFGIQLDLPKPVVGYIDYIEVRLSKKTALIVDHKTTSNLRYALTPNGLKENTQINIYAGFVFENYPEIEEITVRHNYITTRAPFTGKEVEAQLTRVENKERITSYRTVVEEMEKVERGEREAVKNTGFCWKYRQKCHLHNNCFFNIDTGDTEKMEESPLVALLKGEPSKAEEPAISIEEPAISIEEPAISVDKIDKILLVDCRPIKGLEGITLTEALDTVISAVCRDHKVTVVEEVKYAVGWATVAQQFEWKKGCIYAQTNTKAWAAVGEKLVRQADVVIW